MHLFIKLLNYTLSASTSLWCWRMLKNVWFHTKRFWRVLWSAVLTHLDRSEIVAAQVKMMIIRFNVNSTLRIINFQFERYSLQEAFESQILTFFYQYDMELRLIRKKNQFWNQGWTSNKLINLIHKRQTRTVPNLALHASSTWISSS